MNLLPQLKAWMVLSTVIHGVLRLAKVHSKTSCTGIVAALLLPLCGSAIAAEPANSTATESQKIVLSPTQKRRLTVAGQLYAGALEQPPASPERQRLLRDFMERTQELLKELPDAANVWLLRASAAIELNEPRLGWEAGKNLIRLGLEDSADEQVQAVFTKLERKGWLNSDLIQELNRKEEAEKLKILEAAKQTVEAAKQAEAQQQKEAAQRDEKSRELEAVTKKLTAIQKGFSGIYRETEGGVVKTGKFTGVRYKFKAAQFFCL